MDLKSDLLRDLDARGLLNACTDLAGLDALLASGQRVAVYAGFDATGDSLHVGHLVAIMALRAFRDAGHRIVPLCGTATALIGDPSGRNSARPALSHDRLAVNLDGVRASLRAVLGADAELRSNGWLEEMDVISFLREVGSVIPVTHILALESVKSRLADGGTMSVLEFAYPLMQAFDFLHLAREARDEGLAMIQLGGSDQWGNICTGLELIAKKEPELRAFGLTTPLLTKSDGTKMGKTAEGAVWLNREKLDDFGFFQFWRDMDDADAARIARVFLADPSEVGRLDANTLKVKLAETATDLVRGAGAGARMAQAARDVFAGTGTAGLREITIAPGDLADLPALLVASGLASSKSAARRLIAQGGCRLDGQVLPGDATALSVEALPEGRARLSAGRKNHVALILR